MDTIFKDTFHDGAETVNRAHYYAISFNGLLEKDSNPSKLVENYCKTMRRVCSEHGKAAKTQLKLDSSDYVKIAGILKSMTMWLTSLEAAGKNLAISPDSHSDRAIAATRMGLIQSLHQSLQVALG